MRKGREVVGGSNEPSIITAVKWFGAGRLEEDILKE
jgi:hypothetical protein